MLEENLFNKIMKKLDEISKSPGELTEKEESLLRKLYFSVCKADKISDRSGWKVSWKVSKYKDENSTQPYEVVNAGQNVILNSGANLMLKLICGESSEFLNGGYAKIIVGDNSSAESSSQTGPLGNHSSANMARGFPAISGNKAVFEAAFGQGKANFAWNEICISSKYTPINRKVIQGFGTKPSTEIWVVQAALEIVSA